MTIETGNVCRICGRQIKGNDYMVISNKIVCNNCQDQISAMKLSVMDYEREMNETSSNGGANNAYCADGECLKPMEIKALLDQYVVGQENAKKVLSVACYNHYKRNKMQDRGIKKSNILMIGPTGSGKTYLVETLGKILNVPVAIAAATTLTEAGYIGDDVESVVKKLLDAAGGDVKMAEKGIIFIDEVDKLTSKSSETEKKVGGKGVQQALLKLLEGTIVTVGKDEMGARSLGFKPNIDTSGILFICAGAFEEMENIIKKRIGKKTSIGFTANVVNDDLCEENVLHKVTNEDLRVYGLIPEFIGRLPIITSLDSLDVDRLKKILFEPKDSLVSQYRRLLQFDGIDIIFEDAALELIAKKAYELGTGARALRSIMENLLMDIMYRLPSTDDIQEVYISRKFVEGLAEPEYVKRNSFMRNKYA